MANIKIFVGDIMKALEIIKKNRKIKKISQDYMADKLQIARSTYQAIESGQNNMNIIDFFKIIEILDIPITSFSKEEIVIIEKNDLNKLLVYSQEIQKIIKKINDQTQNIEINDNHGTITINQSNDKKEK